MSTSVPEQPRAQSVEFVEGERLIGQGVGIHWPKLDEDISVRGLLLPEVAVAPSRKSA